MTHSELDTWRKRIPWFIFAFCVLPWFFINFRDISEAKRRNEVFGSIVVTVLTYFYVGSDFRRSLWKKEIDAHVGKQIRSALLAMVPEDLAVTEAEKERLLGGEIFKELTGVFWEAVDRNERLRSHKEHFYSNGIVYSTSIDVWLIFCLAGFLYVIASLMAKKPDLAYVGVCLIGVAVASKAIVTPRRRARHLALSSEQLDLLRRTESDFVSTRFREIIIGWRRENVLNLG